MTRPRRIPDDLLPDGPVVLGRNCSRSECSRPLVGRGLCAVHLRDRLDAWRRIGGRRLACDCSGLAFEYSPHYDDRPTWGEHPELPEWAPTRRISLDGKPTFNTLICGECGRIEFVGRCSEHPDLTIPMEGLARPGVSEHGFLTATRARRGRGGFMPGSYR